jgi:two-component sensor histidine kinase/PAS domain-containing protein
MRAISDWLFGAAARSPLESDRLLGPEIQIAQTAADLILAISYLAILGGLIWFLRRRPDLVRDHWLLGLLIGCFLALSAVVRCADAISAWHPIPEMLVLSKVAAALVFAAAIVALVPLLPNLVRLPSARQLHDANEQLRREVAAHESTLLELETARRDLESRVSERTRDLGLVTARFKTALRGARVYVSSQDRNLRYIAITEPMLGLEVDEIVGRTDDDILPPESRKEIVALKRRALDSGLPSDAEVSIGTGAAALCYDFHVEPLLDAAGAVVGVTCAAVDITERRRGEDHLRLLLRELTHRSKNLLAVIQAMARQTARHAGSTDTFLDQFGARLQALATSHDLLIQESWHGVSLEELVRSQLGPHLDRGVPQVVIAGDGVLLKPDVAQNLGLALHELAANAEKFGALSDPNGRISIAWRRVPQSDGEAVELLWAESGGPRVGSPMRRGFGTLVLEGNLPRSLDAQVELAFAAEGVRCRILIPASRLSSLGSAGARGF